MGCAGGCGNGAGGVGVTGGVEYRRWDVIDATVTGWAHYGVLIETDDGQHGFVHFTYVNPPAWPEPGERVRGVVLGVEHLGVRLAVMRGYVEAIEGAENPAAAARAWDGSGHRPPKPPIDVSW